MLVERPLRVETYATWNGRNIDAVRDMADISQNTILNIEFKGTLLLVSGYTRDFFYVKDQEVALNETIVLFEGGGFAIMPKDMLHKRFKMQYETGFQVS